MGHKIGPWLLLLGSLVLKENMAHLCSLPQGKRRQDPAPRGEAYGFLHRVRKCASILGFIGCPVPLSPMFSDRSFSNTGAILNFTCLYSSLFPSRIGSKSRWGLVVLLNGLSETPTIILESTVSGRTYHPD